MKTIQKFIFDDTPVAQAGRQKSFTISGDDGAVFSLQIKRGSFIILMQKILLAMKLN